MRRKVAAYVDGREAEYSPSAVFERQTVGGCVRVKTRVPDGYADLFRHLSALLPPPYYVLYILHTPRGEGQPGRYQSPALSRTEVDGLLTKYRSFFAEDGRHDLWIHSPTVRRTLVWDRHDDLFVEGERLDDVIKALLDQRFSEGALEPLTQHIHHYRPEFDADAANLLREFDWHRTPLRPEDEQ